MFEGHEGEQHKGELKVMFYGVKFTSILKAVNMLKKVKPGKLYKIYYRKKTIVVAEEEMKYYYHHAWWTEWNDLRYCIDKELNW